jgi:hypothetical protein
VITRIINVLSIRENGIIAGLRYFSWSDIEYIKWDHLLRKEKLNIKLKGIDKTHLVEVPWKYHLAVADFIKEKYPSNS